MAEETEDLQVNIKFASDPEVYWMLDELVKEADSDKAKFTRNLIRAEYRRFQRRKTRLVSQKVTE